MGLLDKVKSQAEHAAAKAREGIEDVQTKRELGQAYDDLGRKAFELVEGHELEHAALTPLVERIRELKAKLDAEETAEPQAAGTTPAA